MEENVFGIIPLSWHRRMGGVSSCFQCQVVGGISGLVMVMGVATRRFEGLVAMHSLALAWPHKICHFDCFLVTIWITTISQHDVLYRGNIFIMWMQFSFRFTQCRWLYHSQLFHFSLCRLILSSYLLS